MSEELVVRTTEAGALVNPRTGAVVTEDSDDEDLVDFLVFLRDGKKLIDSIDGDVSQWLRERADARQRWTLAGGRASMPSNRPTAEWDDKALATTLDLLVGGGDVTPEQRDACFRVKREVVAAQVKALLDTASPRAARMINACKVLTEKTSRRVTVSP